MTGGATGGGDPLDVSLEDTDLLEEVELVSQLIVAAGDAAGPLPADQIDALLGVVPPDD